MSDDIVISVENVSKAYRIWNDPGARLKSPLVGACGGLLPRGSAIRRRCEAKATSYYRDFYALKDITFQVRKGESVGIIGRNGSGKSTLLQIIAGTLQPTAGSVHVRGRVAALLELGSGFNPEFTGRENVYLNAAVLGLSRSDTDAKFDSIAAFADIGDFLDQPVKTYSSGMMMRLAFAVQTAVEPDILIVDEALSVGDAPFQAKCFARIRSLQENGCSTLFVSHDIGTVRTFCQQAVWLSRGQAQAQGGAITVCDAYNRDCLRSMGMTFAENKRCEPDPTAPSAPARSRWLEEDRSEFQACSTAGRHGDASVQLRNFFVLNQAGTRTNVLHWDENVTAVFVLGSEAGYTGMFQLGLVCKTLQGHELLCCSDRTHNVTLQLPPGGELAFALRTRLPLRAGKYQLTTGVFLFPDQARFPMGTFDFTQATVTDFVTTAAFVEIAPQFNLGIYGPVQQAARLSTEADFVSAPAHEPITIPQ
ncbi:MAG: polysaccharide ABC transporter ATP-binding protein [Opitutaceae bacterium]